MSQIAYIVTKDVRHLGTWTQNSEQTESYGPLGAQRPICGGRVRPFSATLWPGFPYEDQRMLTRAMARPVCKPCLKTLAALNEVAS